MSQDSRTVGYLAADAEVKSTAKGIEIASFRIGQSRKTAVGDKTNWYTVKAFGNWVQTVKDLKKGDKVQVIGPSNQEEYVNKEGKTVQYTEIILSGLEIFSKKADRAQSTPEQQAPKKVDHPFYGAEEIPF